MVYQLEFERLLSYDDREVGITLPASLKSNGQSLNIAAKLDTGASCCIFECRFGEELGFVIESGLRQSFSTATGTFVAYGHEVIQSVRGYSDKR